MEFVMVFWSADAVITDVGRTVEEKVVMATYF
jgi:hypothetical protein